ncbi:MAG: 4Fe-4S binding protein [Chloroflexi bacterium]|nr:4Fe-4S binding protein [Chloroflexota bacterium]
MDLPIYQQPTSGACIRCMRCLSECPTGAIHVGRPGWSLETDRAGAPVSVD